MWSFRQKGEHRKGGGEVEIDDRVADSDQAIILDQVLNGVASRMSILYLLLGSKEEG